MSQNPPRPAGAIRGPQEPSAQTTAFPSAEWVAEQSLAYLHSLHPKVVASRRECGKRRGRLVAPTERWG